MIQLCTKNIKSEMNYIKDNFEERVQKRRNKVLNILSRLFIYYNLVQRLQHNNNTC